MTADLKLLAAPVQGVTDSAWRNAQHEIFGGVDGYYTPFLRVERGEIRRRDIVDAEPGANRVQHLVPQVLACREQDMALMVSRLADMGYREIDINLGCPFPPIALHRKGSGMLAHPADAAAMFRSLKRFGDICFSVKMRLGWDDACQWRDILPLLSIISPTHVTVHPRTGRQQYKGELLLDEFGELLRQCDFPVVFNGGVRTLADIAAVRERFPAVAGVMTGRGLLEDPAMLAPERATPDRYRLFHDRLYEVYAARLTGGDHQLVAKMKSLWEYFLPSAPAKARKAIRKATTLAKYHAAATAALSCAV